MSVTLRTHCDSCQASADGGHTPIRWSRIVVEYYAEAKQSTLSRELHFCPDCLNRRFAGVQMVESLYG